MQYLLSHLLSYFYFNTVFEDIEKALKTNTTKFYLSIFLLYFNKDYKYNLGFRAILDIKSPREFLYASVSDGKFYHITTSFKL